LSDEEAIAILMSRRGSMYDPLVVDTFIAVKDKLAEAFMRSVALEGAQPIPQADRSIEPTEKMPALNHDFSQALRTILASVQAELDVSLILAFIRDPVRDDIFVGDLIGPESHRVLPFRMAVGSRVTGWVVANGRRIANADSHLELENVFRDNRVCLSVPLLSDGAVVGALTLFSQSGKSFDESSIAYVESVARSFDAPLMQNLIAKQMGTRPPATPKQPTVH
jgi:hypothetical protein